MTHRFKDLELAAEAALGEAPAIDFRKLIALDHDPKKQDALRRILIAEEDKLARKRKQLEDIERLSRKGRELVRTSKARHEAANGTRSADGLRDYRVSVELMETIQQLFESFHHHVRTIYPYSVKLHDEIVGICATLEEARRRAQEFADANPDVFVTVVDARQGQSETFYQQGC
jgi:hypothetical protein